MTKRMLVATILLAIALEAPLLAVGGLSGDTEINLEINPNAGLFETLDTSLRVGFTIGGLAFNIDTILLVSGIWPWQVFSVAGSIGAYDVKAHTLFGGTGEYLYGEWIAMMRLSGLELEIHGAQMGSAILGGPANGWAVRGVAFAEPFEFVGTIEFGAQIEDDDNGGIDIVHAMTGLRQHFSTDPRTLGGGGFTGFKCEATRLGFCCTREINAEVYFTCAGFDHASLVVEELHIQDIAWLGIDAALEFQQDAKTLTVSPHFVLRKTVCLSLCADLALVSSTELSGFKLYGVEMVCELGPVTVRKVSVFIPSDACILTEEFGGDVVKIAEALANGWSYYPDYWELLSIGHAKPGYCQGEFTFLANVYFGKDSAQLFDCAMLHVETDIPFSDRLGLSLGAEIEESGVTWLSLGIDLSW